ncbi:MAG: carbohydrate ABC transporter permease [Treponema sp.]|jgi:putative aldouronate transport system permease protein|nr:carbohydrate ABC transporter permease [Treponema sp.]
MERKKKYINGQSVGDFVFDSLNGFLMILFCLLVIYPLWYIVTLSFNDGADAMRGGIYFWPRVFTLENYKRVFAEAQVINAFFITVSRTVIGVVSGVFFTSMVAYGLSKTHLIGRKLYMLIGVVTLFFSGGLIPYFMLLRNLHLIDTFLVFIIPSLFGFYNCLIFITFFQSIPDSLEESAIVDGANEFLIFIRIILPLSKAVLATIALFVGVNHWNDYFSGVVYINKASLMPIQTYLYRVVVAGGSSRLAANMPAGMMRFTSSQALKLATMVVTTVPILCVYPFLQKFFVKGVLIGAVKG